MRLLLLTVLGLAFLAVTIASEDSEQEISEQGDSLIEQDVGKTDEERSLPDVAASRTLREEKKRRDRENRPKKIIKKRNKGKMVNKSSRRHRHRQERKYTNRNGMRGHRGRTKTHKTNTNKNQAKNTNTNCMRDIIWAHRLKTKGENYKRQAQRMMRFNKTSGSKLRKMSVFAKTLTMLTDIGGGNKSALTCGGDTDTTSVGAKSLNSVLVTLEECQTTLPTICNASAYSLPPDLDMMMSCKDNFVELAKALKSCGSLNPDTTSEEELCSCYTGGGNATFAAIIAKAKDCSVLTTYNTGTTESHKKCTDAYKACISAKESSCDIIYTCSQSASALTTKAAQTSANNNSIANAISKIKDIASGTPARGAVVVLKSCANLIALSQQLQTAATNSPSSPLVQILADQITASSASCSAAQQITLQIQAAVLDVVRAAVQVVLDILTAVIEAATGSAPSIDNGSSVTARAMSRRNMLVRHLMNKM